MDIGAFIKNVRKNNSGSISWILFYVCSLMVSTTEVGRKLSWILIMYMSYAYYDKYLKLYTGKQDTITSPKFADIIKSHNFDIALYFKYLRKCFVAPTLIGVVLCMVWAIFSGDMMWCVDAGEFIIIPLIVSYVEESLTYKRMHEELPKVWNVVEGIVMNIVKFSAFVMAYVSVVLIIIEGLWPVVAKSVTGEFTETEVICTIFAHYWVYVWIIASLFFVLAFADFSKASVRVRRCIRIVFFTACIIVLIASVFGLRYNHIVIKDQEFVVVRQGKSTKYGIDDIKKTRVFFDHTFEVKLYFEDGTDICLINGISDSSEAWEKKYDNEYSYIVFLVEELDKRGVKLEIDDVDKLKSEVSNLNKECQTDFERILEIMERSSGSDT